MAIRLVGYKGLENAFDTVRQYEQANRLDGLKTQWRAHPNLTIHTSNEAVKIAPSALDSYIEGAHRVTLDSGREVGIGYSCSLDGKTIAMIQPVVLGSYGSVDVLSKKLYDNEFREILEEIKVGSTDQRKAGYGHTHPRGFGPVFSLVSHNLPYGNDWEIAHTTKTARQEWRDAPYHLMGAPFMNLFGVVEALPNGQAVYHPWEIDPSIDRQRDEHRQALKELAELGRGIASRTPIRISTKRPKVRAVQ
ncbi:MAG: hypothetical protein HY361_00605 [Candidatus Aenigmarchaeota archaeon]|nr:hypothetical protein [Candidatus Aenigmarchaeota archaeon]